MNKTVAEIAKELGGKVVGDDSVKISGFGGIEDAGEGDITFLANPKYTSQLKHTKASAVFIGSDVSAPATVNCIVVDNPSLAFSRAVSLFGNFDNVPEPGVHPSAVIDESVYLGDNVTVGPHAVIEKNVRLGKNTIVSAGCFIGRDTQIGVGCRFYPNVTITHGNVIGDRVSVHSGSVIGSDGFGYVQEGGEHHKIPQIGNVVIEDDVEIGANVTIDRARFDKTFIGRGSKIDNLVQIAHNVIIEEKCIIIAQVGISGSSKIEKGSILAGQAGVNGHITIGAGSVVSAKTGVTRSLPPKSRVWGYPELPYREAHRINSVLRSLPQLIKDFKAHLKKHS